MKINQLAFYAVMFFGVFLAGIAQIFLKTAACRSYRYWLEQYLNKYVVSGYSLMVLSTVCTLIAMKRVSLKSMPVWNAFGILWAVIWGRIVFKESMNKRKISGILLVAAGMVVFVL